MISKEIFIKLLTSSIIFSSIYTYLVFKYVPHEDVEDKKEKV